MSSNNESSSEAESNVTSLLYPNNGGSSSEIEGEKHTSPEKSCDDGESQRDSESGNETRNAVNNLKMIVENDDVDKDRTHRKSTNDTDQTGESSTTLMWESMLAMQEELKLLKRSRGMNDDEQDEDTLPKKRKKKNNQLSSGDTEQLSSATTRQLRSAKHLEQLSPAKTSNQSLRLKKKAKKKKDKNVSTCSQSARDSTRSRTKLKSVVVPISLPSSAAPSKPTVVATPADDIVSLHPDMDDDIHNELHDDILDDGNDPEDPEAFETSDVEEEFQDMLNSIDILGEEEHRYRVNGQRKLMRLGKLNCLKRHLALCR